MRSNNSNKVLYSLMKSKVLDIFRKFSPSVNVSLNGNKFYILLVVVNRQMVLLHNNLIPSLSRSGYGPE